MAEWKPIETAPMGEWIMVFSPEAERCMVAQNFGTGAFGDDNGTFMQPTHWMPLPESPSVA